MTVLQDRLAKPINPANPVEKRVDGRERVPMSLPHQKLSAPELPGYHLHWMMGRPDRLAQAQKAGYTFVDQDEVDMNTTGLADGAETSGHTDLGTRVSQITGIDETGGQPTRLYLMKIPLEWWEEDQGKLAEVNEGIAAVIRGERGFQAPQGDNSNRYIPKDAGNKFLFRPKRNV